MLEFGVEAEFQNPCRRTVTGEVSFSFLQLHPGRIIALSVNAQEMLSEFHKTFVRGAALHRFFFIGYKMVPVAEAILPTGTHNDRLLIGAADIVITFYGNDDICRH